MIVTVHDYSPLSAFPKWHESGKYFFYRYYVYFVRKSVINRSRAIISVSDFTKKEIIKRFKKKLILTIPEGIDLRFKKLSGYKSKNYFLAMADFSPRKNIIRVLKSYSLLPYDIKLKYKFKIVVSMDYPIGLIMQFTRKSGITNYVSIIKSPSNGELVKKYNRAFCFIYPSLYEGFGLPILEAMACGCPVITSNFDPMKEIAGNAAVLVNPYSVEEIRSAMENIINDQNLREKLIKNGNNRIRKYSWEKTAKQTLNFYEKIYRS
jgi:glycosyltransferase involved in cell wall biosynthesis